VQNRLRSKM